MNIPFAAQNEISNIKQNKQIITKWKDKQKNSLITSLEFRQLKPLSNNSLLVKILAVPTHGSFWTATNLKASFPRLNKLLQNGEFVFGNGGVGQVLEVGQNVSKAKVGDFVAIFGHIGCQHDDCYACRIAKRYVECEYGESATLGRGRYDGTYAEYALIPEESLEVCYRLEDEPQLTDLLPMAFAFLVADVRNALTRIPNTLSRNRVLLISAGLSSHIAAKIILDANKDASIFVIEPNNSRLQSLISLAPKRIEGIDFKPQNLVSALELKELSLLLRAKMRAHFDDKNCHLVVDCASADACPIWFNDRILSHDTRCIFFGFGVKEVNISSQLIQKSGLILQFSRGPGDPQNQRGAIQFLKSPSGKIFIEQYFIQKMQHFDSWEKLETYIKYHHKLNTSHVDVPNCLIIPENLD